MATDEGAQNLVEINVAICRLLGLDSTKVQELDVCVRPGQYPEVRVQWVPVRALDHTQTAVIKRFELRPKA